MAQTGYTPISLYYSSTASNTPTAGNLVAGELAINTADGKLFYKDSSGVVQTIASKGAGTVAGSTGYVQYNNAGALGASSNFYWDITNSRLGIGNTSPAGPLDVYGRTFWGSTTRSGITPSTTSGMYIYQENNGGSYEIAAKVGGTSNTGGGSTRFFFDPTGIFQIQVQDQIAITIDNSRNFGIGTATPSTKLDVSGTGDIKATVQSTSSGSGANAAITIKTATEGNWLIQTGNVVSSGLRFNDAGGERIRFTPAGNLEVKTSNAGIVFSNSSAVTNSTLNDYETGSFSPTILFGGGNTGQTFNNGPNGRYVKIGKFVYITIGWYFSSKGSSTGAMTIGNLPFTADNFGFYGTYAPTCLTSLTSVTNNVTAIGTNGGTNFATVYQGDCGTALTNSNISNVTYALIGFSYTANF